MSTSFDTMNWRLKIRPDIPLATKRSSPHRSPTLQTSTFFPQRLKLRARLHYAAVNGIPARYIVANLCAGAFVRVRTHVCVCVVGACVTKRVSSGDEKNSTSQQMFNASSLNKRASDFKQFTEFLNRGRPRFASSRQNDGTHPPTHLYVTRYKVWNIVQLKHRRCE